MGRRALRRVDPALDLSGHLLAAEQLADDALLASLFERPAPLEIEVGSGKGLFLETATAAVPGHNFLGVEIAGRYARFAAARLARGERTNGRVIHGDAIPLIADRVPNGTLHAVHVYFPDPWWKKRHHKRRVMRESFVACVERKLEPGGMLHFWTDVEDYYRAGLEAIAAATSLSGPNPVAERPAAHTLDYHTHFERRTRLHDQPVFRARFVKR